MKYRNLTIIGTSHIAKESINEIKNTFSALKPDIVAVELDKNRLYALLHDVKRKIRLRDIGRVGVKGFLFAVIGSYIQRKLGKYVKIEPGADMLTAVKLAKSNKAKLALIDQDISITLKRFSQTFTWREKWNFVVDIFRMVIFRKQELKKLGIKDLDLTKVPAKTLIKTLLHKVKIRYPNLYNVLVTERNQIMSSNLIELMHENPDKTILAIVGAGHCDGLLGLIKEKDHNAVTYSFSVG